MAPKMLLAASNGHGLSSGGPVATTLTPHMHCGEAMCLAPTACSIVQRETSGHAGRQKVLPQGEGWVHVGRAVALAASHRLCFERKVLSVVWPSSIGLEGDAFGASSVTIRSTHAAVPSNASVVTILVIGSIFVVHGFLPLVLALQTLVLVLRMLLLLASGAALRSLSLVVPCCLGVGLRSSATHQCMQRCHQYPLLGVARSSVSTLVWTLSFSHKLP
jgi:hypothetical protein